ncbi:CHAT domain-containing protein [Streptomyces sp. NPDC057623]|uniref:CHAT domain-containing protein n=1 Tax=Streptomyces sp. NPDC057623 TaxID=3346187 RepID=UPI0036C21589
MRQDRHDLVAALVGRVKEALASGDRERMFDTGLDRFAVKALRRARSSYSLCRMVFETMAVLHRERSRALDGEEAALHHDLALLFGHSRYAAQPLALLREADVLRGGRHRPSARRRLGDQRPFTQYLSGKRQLVELRSGEPGDDVLRDAHVLSEQLNDPYLRADVDDFLRSLGAEPPRRPASVPPPVTPASPRVPGGSSATEGAARALLTQEALALREAQRQEAEFHRTKDPDALDGAMKAMSRAVECAMLTGARARSLSHGMEIGRLNATRFGHLGDWDDYVHAVASMRMVIGQLPPDDPAVVGCLLQLGVTLEGGHEYMFDKYGPRCGTENIDAAVAELRRAWRAVEAGVAAPDDEDLPGTILTMLGHSLLLRALVRADADAADLDLTEALDLLDRATALLGDGGDGPDLPLTGGRGTPGRGQVVSLLRMYRVQARILRAMADGDVAALEEQIVTARRRLHTAGSPPARPQWQVMLGSAQVFADMLAGRATDPSVPTMLSQAAQGGTGSEGPQRALRYARLAATVALRQHQWAEAAHLLGESLRQIHAQRAHGIPDSARVAWLQQGRDFASDLVTCLVALGRAQEAAVAFEEHRAVLLSEALGHRADMVGLDLVAPELARDHRAAVRELRRFETGTDAHRPQHRAERRRLLDARDRTAERIREVEGFQRFGQPPRFADLATGAHEGPAVLLNTGSLRGDALVLQDGEVSVVPLPHARADRLEAAVGTLHRALHAAEQARAGGDNTAYLRQQRAVTGVLEQLWDWVAAPVWERIGTGGTAADPPRRIWWVPSGPLWFLPLHTASAAGGPSLADLAVSSYVPTLRMLKLSRRRSPGRLRDPLVVSVPHAPGAAPLPGAEAEAGLVAALAPGARVLHGPAATREAVLDALGSHPCLHFAGHGINTSDGTLLVLHDSQEHPLTAQDVLDQDLPGGDLAYLSACEAAQTSVLLPDEATHFGAALSVAGYRHVIGTLWRVDDGVAVEAARRFYGHLTEADFDPALALHRTVRELRAAYPSMPGLWAAHIHIGP